MRRFLRLSPEAAPIHRVHPLGSLHLALVDTCVPGQMHGHLDDEALDLVESSLAPLSQDARALLVMHHPLRLLGHGSWTPCWPSARPPGSNAGQLPSEFTGDLAGVIDSGAPPAFLVHHISGDDLVSYVRTVGTVVDVPAGT